MDTGFVRLLEKTVVDFEVANSKGAYFCVVCHRHGMLVPQTEHPPFHCGQPMVWRPLNVRVGKTPIDIDYENGGSHYSGWWWKQDDSREDG